MRDLSELNINELGEPVKRAAPSEEAIDAFQSLYGVTLPEIYLFFLRHTNGGHPEVDSVAPIDSADEGEWAVNRFFHLDDDRTAVDSLWTEIETWRPVLGKNALPIGDDGLGNVYFIDLTPSSYAVKVCIHDDNFSVRELAPSFEAFIDGLFIDPEMI